jgi:hypothetical protein
VPRPPSTFDGEADEEHAPRIDAREEDGALLVADGVDLAAERGAGEHEDRRSGDGEPDQQRIRHARDEAPDGKLPHQDGSLVLRRETAGVVHHQALRDRVHAEREDHRRRAEIGDAEAVDQSDNGSAEDAERDGKRIPEHVAEEGLGAGRHHPADRDGPGERQVDVAEEDDEHHAGGHDAEERGHLQLLHEVVGR